jgi:hypothetical protein
MTVSSTTYNPYLFGNQQSNNKATNYNVENNFDKNIKTTTNTEMNIYDKLSKIENLNPNDISYEDYKQLSSTDINKLFLGDNLTLNNNTYQSFALFNIANNYEDIILSNKLFEYQLNNNQNTAQKFLKEDINQAMLLKYDDIFMEFAEKVLGQLLEGMVENGNKITPQLERELATRDDAFDINKKLQYASKHNKISSEDFFNYLEEKHQNIKNYRHDPMAMSDLRDTEYYKNIDEIIYETTKLKENYEKLQNDENALLHYLTKDYTKEIFA